MSEQTASSLLNPDDLPVATDREAAWHQLRELGPAFKITGGVAITSMSAAETVLKDPIGFSSEQALNHLGSPVPIIPAATDPPAHTRYRRILQPYFNPRGIRPIENALRGQVAELIDAVVGEGQCELVTAVAEPFPVRAFMALFGLPDEDGRQLTTWSNSIFSNFRSDHGDAAAELRNRHAGEFFAYLENLIRSRRGQAGDDVLSQILCLEGADALSDQEALGLAYLVVLAGLDTVTGMIGQSMAVLARNPAARREIVDDPSLIPAAVEELLRLETSIPVVLRVATRDVEIEGCPIAAGTMVHIYTTTANRESDRFEDPLEINFHRPANPHAGLGLGPHRCLGSHLARLELKLFFEEWHKRIPSYHITPGTEPRTNYPRGSLTLDALHLSFGDAAP